MRRSSPSKTVQNLVRSGIAMNTKSNNKRGRNEPSDTRSTPTEDITKSDELDSALKHWLGTNAVQSFATGKVLNVIEVFCSFDRAEKKREWADKVDSGGWTEHLVEIWPLFWNHDYISDMQNPYSFPTRTNLTSCLKILWQGTLHSIKMTNVFVEADGVELLGSALKSNEISSDAASSNPIVAYILTSILNIILNCLYRRSATTRATIEKQDTISQIEALSHCSDFNVRNMAEALLLSLSSYFDNIKVDENSVKFAVTLLQQHLAKKTADSEMNSVVMLDVMIQASVKDANKVFVTKADIVHVYQQWMGDLMQNNNQRLLLPMCYLIWQLAFSQEFRDKVKKKHSILKQLDEIAVDGDNPASFQASGAIYIIFMKYELLMSNNPLEKSDASTLKFPTPERERSKSIKTKPTKRGRSSNKKGTKCATKRKSIPPSSSPSESSSVDNNEHNICVSYAVQDYENVRSLQDILTQNSIHITVHEPDAQLTTIEQNLSKANVVLVCTSEYFERSALCRTQAIIMQTLNKAFMLIRIDENFEPVGWLKQLMRQAEPVSLLHSSLIVQELSSYAIKCSMTPQPQNAEESPSTPCNPEDWDCVQVTNWFKSLKIEIEDKLNGMDGSCLLSLKSMKTTAPQAFYSTLQHELQFTLKDTLVIAHNLDKLLPS